MEFILQMIREAYAAGEREPVRSATILANDRARAFQLLDQPKVSPHRS